MMAKPGIICTDDWIMKFMDNCRYLNKYNFLNQKWSIIQCENLPFFVHYTMQLLERRYLAVHGTDDSNRLVYKTYIGDVTQRPTIKFNHITTLNTLILFGQHLTVKVGTSIYALTVYDLRSMNAISVHRLVDGNWDLTYQGTNQNSRATRHVPIMEHIVLHHNNELFIFPLLGTGYYNNFSPMFVFNLESNVWRQTDFIPFTWTSSNTFYNNFSLAQCPVETRYVYLTFTYIQCQTTWPVCRLDLDTGTWDWSPHRFPRVVSSYEWVRTVITRSGRHVAVIALDHPTEFYLPDDIVDLRVFSGWIRLPRLEDRALEEFATVMQLTPNQPADFFDRILPPSLAVKFKNARDNSDDNPRR